MQVLTIQEETRLLRLLFTCDAKTFSAIRSDFVNAFSQQQDRLRACCAALLLLEDSRALSTAQRLGTWYTLFAGWDSQPGTTGTPNPFVPYLVEVAGDVRRSAVERHLVLQLLQSYQMPQLDGSSPLDYAMSYSLPLTCSPPDLGSLRAQYTAGPPPGPGADLDAVLQDKKKHLLSLAAAVAPLPAISATATLLTNGNIRNFSSSVSEHGSLPSTPARKLTASTAPTTPAGGLLSATETGAQQSLAETPSTPGMAPMSHPLVGDLQGGAVGSGAGLDWTADGSGSGGRGSSAGNTPVSLGPVLELIERALQGPLMPAQQSQVLEAMARDPTIISKLGLCPAQLPALVEHTPSIAVELLSRLSGSPALPDYLAMLAHSEMSLHSMEVVNRLTACMELPTDFLHLYIANCINSCEATADKYVQSRLVRLLCVFLQSLIRNRIINIADLLHEVQSFCVNFSRIREAAKLFRLLKQIEAGGRLGLADGLGSPTAGNSSMLDGAEGSD